MHKSVEEMKLMITKKRVRELFEYRNGQLFWKKKSSEYSNIKIGDRAGNLRKDGYRLIFINDKPFFEHRLIFLLHHGYLPKEIDHINREKSDNHIENLREVSRSQNQMNSKKAKNRSSKYKGVSWHKNAKKWRSYITKDRNLIHIGYFNTEEEAARAYNKAAIELFGEFAHLNDF